VRLGNATSDAIGCLMDKAPVQPDENEVETVLKYERFHVLEAKFLDKNMLRI
jgi:hypothetical protein